MNKLTPEQIALLKSPLPAEAVKPHPTKSYLSSIKAIYVTERLNDVFGIGGWRTSVQEQRIGDKGMIVVKVTFEVPEYNIYYECFGGNDNGGESSKNFDLGDAYKGATTDAITKIGSYLEIGIDVFKGKSSKSSSGYNSNKQQTKQPIPQVMFEKAIKKLENKETTLEKIEQAFILTKEQKEQMQIIQNG